MRLFEVQSVAQVFRAIDQQFSPLLHRPEIVSLEQAQGRILAETVTAREDVPGFDRSTVDGYAVRAKETIGASESLPAFLTRVGEIRMGEAPSRALHPGETMYIPTGGMLPQGADAVVMIEQVEEVDDLINVFRPVAVHENVIFRGEDVQQGERLLSAGVRLRPQEIGALAAVGIDQVAVVPRLRVAILSTGDEVVPVATPHVQPGQIRDVNAPALAAAVQRDGAQAIAGGIVADDATALMQRCEELLHDADLLLLSGGSSVGTRDLTEQVITALGEPGIFVHGVALHPGKPAILARCGQKAVVGLPGHPVSALLIYDLFVRRILDRLCGHPSLPWQAQIPARLTRNVASHAGQSDYLRVRLLARDDGWWADPIFGKSGLITTLVKADGLIEIPPEREGLREGEGVAVYPLQ